MPLCSAAYLNMFSIRQRAGSSQQRRAGGGGVGGEELQHRRAVLEQGELAGGAATGELDGLIGRRHADPPSFAHGQRPPRRGGPVDQRGAPVGDPVRPASRQPRNAEG